MSNSTIPTASQLSSHTTPFVSERHIPHRPPVRHDSFNNTTSFATAVKIPHGFKRSYEDIASPSDSCQRQSVLTQPPPPAYHPLQHSPQDYTQHSSFISSLSTEPHHYRCSRVPPKDTFDPYDSFVTNPISEISHSSPPHRTSYESAGHKQRPISRSHRSWRFRSLSPRQQSQSASFAPSSNTSYSSGQSSTANRAAVRDATPLELHVLPQY
jgi:hypothetical protein